MNTDESFKREKLPPNYSRFIHALRNIGYSFEEAVADVTDNSIDAKAGKVHLRFIIQKERVDLLIVDNGEGMDPAELREAMRFGGDPVEKKEKRLGMFGLGLKLASIAHAESLLVVSLRDAEYSGRAWTDEGLKEGFACDLLTDEKIQEIASNSEIPNNAGSGTWVYWECLFRFEDEFEFPNEFCEKQVKKLRGYLGLHLHRLLGRTKITIDIYDRNLDELGPERRVVALDPFGYKNSGAKAYPVKMYAPEPSKDHFSIEAHIWPPNSTTKEYKLPGGTNRRQGLYFYRNDRLLSGGTWHGIREEESHSSLARVAIDLEVEVERKASVDVRKARVKLTPEMQEAISSAETADGRTFRQYLSIANENYRTAKKKDPKSFPLVPDEGYPRALTKMLQELLDSGNTGNARTVDFEWYDFEDEEVFFEIDRPEKIIWLNEAFRELFRTGKRLSKNDGVLTKTLLFIILRDLLDTERLAKKKLAYIDQLNEILFASAQNDLSRMGV